MGATESAKSCEMEDLPFLVASDHSLYVTARTVGPVGSLSFGFLVCFPPRLIIICTVLACVARALEGSVAPFPS